MIESASAQRIIRSVVRPDDADQRLDVYLTQRFSYQSRHQWQKLIESGNIRLNDAPVRASRILNPGDTIAFMPPDDVVEPNVDANLRILEEDEQIVAIQKSGNLPCHPSGIYFNNTLWNILKPRYGNLHIVTRLDRETSGVVLCAKSGFASTYVDAMARDDAKKVYYVLVVGAFKTPIHAKGFLFKHPTSPVRKKRAYAEKPPKDELDFEACETILTPIAFSKKCSLVRAEPVTGRLHQIRATLCSLGFPLIGDKLYGINDHFYLKFISDQLSALDLKMLEMPRQALHAAELQFRDPQTQLMKSISSPVPDDMQLIMQKYKLSL